jgi:hypothetical protein
LSLNGLFGFNKLLGLLKFLTVQKNENYNSQIEASLFCVLVHVSSRRTGRIDFENKK